MENLTAKAIELSQLVSYSEGAVVSREILRKEHGTVTVFAFDAGQGLSEHTAPFDAMVTILDGEAVINISRKPHELKKGETIIMPAGEPHSLMAKNKFKMLLTMIKSN
ncbi:MAG TPA: cupin domain-containing protein [Elusimicrobia bacterium]|nr:MAG: cupin [Elusimicrobia bacterium RIFOXYA12_FULL_49_49]OGS09960.1 MAG: cupin [Elusimicrobia bacterium RIFOXYA1_FULL_47_7]OGS15179.1 MAG: cupin [Elusimicrobia bacterium RIFOXYA2_FULL_47_53]OGS26951.1 MAG: cupin [Elusimicrobia bacterium RIFOXYB12_FULL_50_12]OGS29799.1 MAG: cupin [Elusimicrobia bacterium RIFOXYB2_FULL_46_23]HBU70282.1 cupin domain-containing protein [Elusimicrobiota bacterium]